MIVGANGASGKFYIGLNAGPEADELLARALLHNNGRVDVLPSGSAGIRAVKDITVQNVKATLYEITGLSFTPSYVWLDEQRNLLAETGGWSALVRKGFEASVPALEKAQQEVENARSAELAKRLMVAPSGVRSTCFTVSTAGTPAIAAPYFPAAVITS